MKKASTKLALTSQDSVPSPPVSLGLSEHPSRTNWRGTEPANEVNQNGDTAKWTCAILGGISKTGTPKHLLYSHADQRKEFLVRIAKVYLEVQTA